MLEELTLPLPLHPTAATPTATVEIAALVDAHAATLFRVAHSLLRNRAEAEDTVQDTFVRVLEHRGDLPAVRELRPWLVRIAWNLALDRKRRLRPDQADDVFLRRLAAPQLSAEHTLNAMQQAQHTLDAIDRLPQAERQALLLSAVDELATPEIALAMNKSESAIRALVHRARTRLRKRLEKGGPR